MIGRTVSHYEIIEKLGEGGMGVVYKAHDTKLDRDVALKFLSSPITPNEEQKQRFIHEAKAASALDHPNICNIYEIDETPDGQLFIAMRAYEGISLNKKIESGPLAINEVIDYALQIVAGLQAAHEKDIIHRDIKSSNIIITEKGNVKIIDFGLAKLRGGAQLTKTGKAVGSLAYMSPEQLRADDVDVRSDIFSFGIVLYEMITGELPFKGEYEQVIMYSIIYQETTPLSVMRSDVPEELERIVQQCLEKNPDNRYRNAAELVDDLDTLRRRSENPAISPAASDTNPLSASMNTQQRRKTALLSVAVVLLLIVLLFPYIRQYIDDVMGRSPLPSDIHLAVLPFRTISDHSDDQAFNYGLMDVLTSKITQMEITQGSFWIVPTSEIHSREVTSASEAYRAFGVNLVVEGSIYRDAQQIHVTLNLVDSKSLRQLRSWNTVVEAENLPYLHNDMIIHLAKMLEVELKPGYIRMIASGSTDDSRAYELYHQARGYLQHYESVENIERAIGLFEKALNIDNTYALAHAGLGEAYWRMYDATRDPGWIDLAVSHCDHALKLSDDIPSVYIALGMIFHGTGKYEKALDNYQKALDINPVNADAVRGIARAFEELGDLKEAEVTYKRAIRLKPGYWAGYNVLGVFYFRHNRYVDAIEQFKKVIEITPDNVRGYMNLGSMYYLLERWDEAREMFERSLALEKTYDASSNLGTLYFAQGQYAEAARMYETALELNQDDYVIWGNLASAYYWAPGEREKAKVIYEQAIELAKERMIINPKDPIVIANIAGYYAMIGDDELSNDFIQQALTMAPNNAWVMYRAGTTYERLGDREKALNWIENALKEGYPPSDILHQPELQPLISDVRFQQMMEEITE